MDKLKKDKRSYRLDMMRIHRNCIKHIVPTIKLQMDKFWNQDAALNQMWNLKSLP